MADKARIEKAVYAAIDEINMQLPPQKKLDKTHDTILMGDGGRLDSLGVVNLILMTEEMIEDEFGVLVNIADQETTSQNGNPFKNVHTLIDYIAKRLEAEGE